MRFKPSKVILYALEIEVNEGRGDVPSPRLWGTSQQTVLVGLPDTAVKHFGC